MSATFRGCFDVAQAEIDGRSLTSHFRKIPSQASTAGQWVDLSMASGNPLPNYYASEPLVGATLDAFRGIFHGDDKSPSQKMLKDLALCSPTAGLVGAYKLLDFLLYYPFVDLDTTDAQALSTPVALPRYADGVGVRAMMVAVTPTVGGGSFTYEYTSDTGAARTSAVIRCNTTADSIATVCTSQQGTVAGGTLFLPLVSGDRGIREITAVNMIVPNGGLAAFVLVRPLAGASIREVSVTDERTYVTETQAPPVIEDGAYLNLVVNCAGSVAAGQLAGRATFVWS